MATQLREKLNDLLIQKKLSKNELKKILTVLSDPWEDARGILRDKKVDAVKYQKETRKEWHR
jgi:hypothetical protein